MAMNQPPDLRALAEEQLGQDSAKKNSRAEQIQHELQVHQIELEMQNDALRQAQADLLESRDRYLDLYDFAPVGYLTTSSSGIIQAINLTLARWLGTDRQALIGKPLALYIQNMYMDRWYLTLKNNRRVERDEVPEIGFQACDGERFFARLDCLFLAGKDAELTVRITIVNLGSISLAEKKAIDVEHKYRALYESMRDGFALVDMTGRLVRFNKPFQDMLGYSAEELKQKTFIDLTPAKWHAFEARLIGKEVLIDGESSVFEKEYIHKNGLIFPVELKITLLRNADGHAEGMWAVVRDISNRKKSEDQLLSSESRFRLAMKAISGFVYDLDMATNQFVVSEGYAALMGHEFRAGSSIFDWGKAYICPDDFVYLHERFLEAQETKPERFQATFRVRYKDGKWKHVANRTLIVYDENGQPTRVLGSLSDITRRVAAEASLRVLNDSLEEQVVERNIELHSRIVALNDSERFIRATVDELSSALAVIDATGNVIFKNKAWQEISSKQRDDGLQSQLYSPYCLYISGDEECPHYKKLRLIIEGMLKGTRRSISMEYECSASSVSSKRSWVFSRVMRFKGEGPLLLVVSHENITERKLAENEVSRTAKNFKAMLRKVELKHQEHSKQIAREVHDQLGATLTMLKLGLATTLTDQGLAATTHSKIVGILDLANLALRSVKRVSASLRPGMLDTLGFVAAVNWHAKEFSRMTGIETEVSLPEYIELSTTDSETTFRIIQEALTNVAKHAQASKVLIAASTTRRSINVTVSDNGIGLDTNNLRRKNSFGVIGMQERAKHLHGKLSLKRQEAGGTCLKLSIPFVGHSK